MTLEEMKEMELNDTRTLQNANGIDISIQRVVNGWNYIYIYIKEIRVVFVPEILPSVQCNTDNRQPLYNWLPSVDSEKDLNPNAPLYSACMENSKIIDDDFITMYVKRKNGWEKTEYLKERV